MAPRRGPRLLSGFDITPVEMDALAAAVTGYKQFLRRTYASNLAGLEALATTVAAEAAQAVTITSQNFEGAAHAGQVTLPPGVRLAAIEDVIAELDDTVSRGSGWSQAVFS